MSAVLNAPQGVAVDGLGNVYIPDGLNNRIRRVAGGVITAVAGAECLPDFLVTMDQRSALKSATLVQSRWTAREIST